MIPRVLFSIFTIRNKRGVGHIGNISCNQMDATYVLYGVKWVLAEIVRLNSKLSPEESQTFVDSIVERRISLVWEIQDVRRVLNENSKAYEQVLILLSRNSPQSAEILRTSIEYAHTTRFDSILKKLHSKRLVELKPSGDCYISPKGIVEAEKIVARLQNTTT